MSIRSTTLTACPHPLSCASDEPKEQAKSKYAHVERGGGREVFPWVSRSELSQWGSPQNHGWQLWNVKRKRLFSHSAHQTDEETKAQEMKLQSGNTCMLLPERVWHKTYVSQFIPSPLYIWMFCINIDVFTASKYFLHLNPIFILITIIIFLRLHGQLGPTK